MKRIRQLVADLPGNLRRRTTAGSTYRPEIDGMRFFAISMVVIGHMFERVIRFQQPISLPGNFEGTLVGILASPGPGVNLFFAISGFIIANQYLHKKPMPFAPSYLKSYFLRRLLRIEPPYFIILIATYILITVTGYVPAGLHRFHEQPDSLTASLFASLFYVHSPYYGTLPRLFGPGWSLEIEVQFYILAPAFFVVLYFIRNTIIRRVAETGLLALGFVTATIWGSAPTADQGPIFLELTLLAYFLFFWIGVMIADNQGAIQALLKKFPRALTEILPWVGVGVIFLSDSVTSFDGSVGYLTIVISIALVFFGVLDERTSFKKFCSLPWISLIGGACYSIYLVHLQILHVAAGILIKFMHLDSWLVVMMICTVVLIPLVLVSGLIYYAAIERVFMIPDWPRQFLRFVRSSFKRMPA